MLKNLNKNFVLQWISAHCDLECNEKTDRLAKKVESSNKVRSIVYFRNKYNSTP